MARWLIPLSPLCPLSRFSPLCPLRRRPTNGPNGLNGPNGQNGPNRYGQTIIEMVIAVTGIVMFIYVFTRIWTWTSGTIVQRQEAFQATRLAAGQRASAGTPVGYQRPPLRLVGAPDTTGGDVPPGDITLELPPLPCTAAEPFFQQAQILFDEAQALTDQAAKKHAEANLLSLELKRLTAQIRVVCAGSKKKRRCWVVGPFAEIDATKAQLADTEAEAQALTDQAKAKADEASEQIRLGEEACA